MNRMKSLKCLSFYFDTTVNKFNFQFRERLIQMKSYSTVKYTINIMSDIEKELDLGNMKHRKHPGVRKMAPIKLPPFVLDAIYRLISSNHEHAFLTRSSQLCKEILSRRLPVEQEEIQDKIQETSLEISELEESIPEIVRKKRILELKKQLQVEIGRWKHIEYNASESLAYLAGRAAPNFASTLRVLTELKNRVPSFCPKTFFDFGSGIGSAIWAANSLWGDTIKEYFCVDSSPDMNDLSQSILTIEETDQMHIKPVNYRQFLPASENIKYDLVVSAFSLLELPSMKDRLQAIDTLWRKTKNVLVIVEHGTLAGFSTVLDARDYVLHCPHDVSCPLVKKYRDSCGLFVTYQTIFPRQRQVFNKDFISYVVLKKGRRPPDDNTWPRIVRPVLKKSKHVHCRLCCDDGQLHETIVTKARHGRHAYRAARSSSLGDLLPANIQLSTDEVKFPEEIFKDSGYFESDDEENKT
ncbi:ribosome assembly protein METTL17, mitochondrial isoform X2 [Parasteatoda tepidariorum]|uniref:ribosome assembly protein METTL17, mitochondrial isoform X2 n=1 Tax=Parasteatoda tepidariorum TaxID=114398 RepID=UPI001C722444|nr:methyltransferase-like protein 17, mitochondrial isoform X2 [Parasteatoda tepidariorum]